MLPEPLFSSVRRPNRDDAVLALDVVGDELDGAFVLPEVRSYDTDGDAVIGEAENGSRRTCRGFPPVADAHAPLRPEELALDEGAGVAADLDPQLWHI
jgi:hypothetical protein